ncbi:MAG: DUF3180 family protein [Actinomycetales bacterium]|nr:DUF3180 family protein [Actinomycetales bacterium]
MTPTRVRALLAIAAIAAAVGWGAVQVMEGQSGRVVPVPWLAAVTMWLLAVAVGIWAVLSRPRLLRTAGSRPMPPLVAARTAALAMAASRTGALVAGLYAGVAIGAFPSRETQAGSASMWAAIATAIGSLVLAAAALWLERMCRLPSKGDDGGASGDRPRPRAQPDGMGARVGSPS